MHFVQLVTASRGSVIAPQQNAMRVALESSTKTFRFLEEFRVAVVQQVALTEFRYKQTAIGFVASLPEPFSGCIGRLPWNFTAPALRLVERV
jgi:hypothetical protein